MKPPKLSPKTIAALQRVITGNKIDAETEPVAPYRRRPRPHHLLQRIPISDTYPGSGFPSRWFFAEEKLNALNGTQPLADVIEAAVSPVYFLGSKFDAAASVSYLNKYLSFDGYELVSAGKVCRLRRSGETLVEADSRLERRDKASHEFLDEQLSKCDQKPQGGDYDGAITNARSLLEAVLFEIEGRMEPARPNYDGDLPKLYRRVQKLLNLDPARTDISDSLKQILSGLVNVVSGLHRYETRWGTRMSARTSPIVTTQSWPSMQPKQSLTLLSIPLNTRRPPAGYRRKRHRRLT